VNWYNLVSAFRGSLLEQGISPSRQNLSKLGLFKYSKFNSEWRAAASLGLPLGAPDFMGGISHPHFEQTPRKFARQWFAHLSSLPLDRLLLYGGLSLVPLVDGQKNVPVETVFNLRLKPQLKKDTPGGLEVRDVIQRLRGPASSRALFGRSRKVQLSHAPSIRNLSERFHRTLMKSPKGRLGSVRKLKEDLEGKMSRKIPSSQSFTYFGSRIFGVSRNAKPLGPLRWGRRPWMESLG